MNNDMVDFLNERLPHGIELMQITKGNVDWLWNNINKYDSLFSDFSERSLDGFIKRLLEFDNICFKIGETGYVFLEQIQPMRDCKFHGASFDRKLIGKESMAIAVIRLAFEVFQLQRMSAGIPSYARFANGFLKRIGFKQEGTLRDYYRHKGEWYDYHLFGILKKEVP